MSLNGSHEVAIWSGMAAFFGSLLAIGIFDVLNPAEWFEYAGAFFIAGITAGSVYAKERMNEAKQRKEM